MSRRIAAGLLIGGAPLLDLIQMQTEIIQELERTRERDQLEYARNLRDLIGKFRVALEHPEDDIREALEDALRDLDDTVARAEEHIL